ncbi:MAG: patatin-like phospholipase family protein, partial [Pyrinomonadaceae bacterium]|nr:patatin-like phospholipase family protein [Phycisphaerales bacterium]
MQPQSQFRNLVFEGGGVLGIAYAGALRVMQEKGILPDIQRVAGASAGAITAALLAIRYDADGIQKVVAETSFSTFMDAPGGFFGSLVRTFRNYGWFAGSSFSDWMKSCIRSAGLPESITFKELEALADSPENMNSRDNCKYRKLYVVASDISRGIVLQYDANETPNKPIWEAVRASMSIPFFFAGVSDDPSLYKDPDDPSSSGEADDEGRPKVLLVDGGVTWNYPIDVFDDVRFIDNAEEKKLYEDPIKLGLKSVFDEKHVYNKQTLGFRVDSEDEVAAYKNRQQAEARQIKSVVQYSMALIQFMRGLANRSHLKKLDWHR